MSTAIEIVVLGGSGIVQSLKAAIDSNAAGLGHAHELPPEAVRSLLAG